MILKLEYQSLWKKTQFLSGTRNTVSNSILPLQYVPESSKLRDNYRPLDASPYIYISPAIEQVLNLIYLLYLYMLNCTCISDFYGKYKNIIKVHQGPELNKNKIWFFFNLNSIYEGAKEKKNQNVLHF